MAVKEKLLSTYEKTDTQTQRLRHADSFFFSL